jgi:sugar O-acyltransferase (sialic acid O-acetyltransferase NeuD family)
MLIIGAGGFARQLLEVAQQLNKLEEVVLYDDVTFPPMDLVYGRIPVWHNRVQVINRFMAGNRHFILGLANPQQRFKVATVFKKLGGELESLISPHAFVSTLATVIHPGAAILTSAIIENGVNLGEAALINIGVFIAHGVTISEYSEIGPGAKILGNSKVGSFSFVGAGAVILPGVTVGNYAVIGAGAVVNRNVPDRVMVAGVPAVIVKQY